jgi:hypothetical protein
MKRLIASIVLVLVLAVPVGAASAASDNAACIAWGISITPPGLRDDFVHGTQAATDGPYGQFIRTLVDDTSPLCQR